VLGVAFARKTSWGRQGGQRNIGAINLHRIEEALHMSLPDQFTEVEREENSDTS